MTGYLQVNLNMMLQEIGENETKKFFSDFSCPLNLDVEAFLRYRAMEFAKQGISVTHLVMVSYRGKYVLVGYYALAHKVFTINRESLPSQNWKRRLLKFGQYDEELKRYFISSPLIGQIGKNYENNYNKLISGDELLLLAIEKVSEMQMIVGGKTVYLECEDKERLLEFYSRNGFVNFGQRQLENDEIGEMQGEYLIQMLKYLK